MRRRGRARGRCRCGSDPGESGGARDLEKKACAQKNVAAPDRSRNGQRSADNAHQREGDQDGDDPVVDEGDPRSVGLSAQTLKIDDCYRMAREIFPLVKQYELIEKTKEFSIENAQKAYLPQIGVYAQATYQSEVTKIPLDFEALKPILGNNVPTIPEISKDQYKFYGDWSYFHF